MFLSFRGENPLFYWREGKVRKIFKKSKEALIKTFSKAKSRINLGTKKKPAPVKSPVLPEAKEIPSFYETAIANTKFSPSQDTYFAPVRAQDLPAVYDQDRMILQVRDPRWLHTYWETREQTIQGLKNKLGEDFYRGRKILRVYDVTSIIFNGSNANRFFDIPINDFANSWYIDTAGPGRAWCVDLGLMLPDGRFIMILRSNVVQTPLDGPSWVTDEEWMIPDEMFARLYGMGFGLGKSSPVGGAWQERIKQGLFSSGLSSSPVKKEIKERSFWMKVDCELIVYGATEPDAKVTVQGMPIKLRPDGTFTLRYYLPDGKQVIPVKAISADKIDERTITPIVTRETK